MARLYLPAAQATTVNSKTTSTCRGYRGKTAVTAPSV